MSEMTMDQATAIKRFLRREDRISNGPCGCMGPRDGEPKCPCKMAYVEKVNGTYYEVKSHVSGLGRQYTATAIGECNVYD